MVILDLREDESLKNEGVAREVNKCNRSDTLFYKLYICYMGFLLIVLMHFLFSCIVDCQ